MRKLFNRFDAMIIPALLAAALLLYLVTGAPAKRGGEACEVVVDGVTVMTASLSENRVFSPQGLSEVEIEIKDGAAAFIRSDCPDKTCVKTGYISKAGMTSACLPNRVAIRITGTGAGGGDEPDVVI